MIAIKYQRSQNGLFGWLLSFQKFNYMPHFFHYSYKSGNLALYKPVVSFYKGEEPRKKEDWLNNGSR